MMKFDCLLAKSHKQDEPWHRSMLLSEHLSDVYAAALQVLDATGDDQLLALGLDPASFSERFRRIVLLAAAVHDLGKANDHFQGMIHGQRDVGVKPQGLRHEWVTVLMLARLRDWLLPAVGGSADDFAIVEWAVSGHHPARYHSSPPRLNPPGAGAMIKLLTKHDDFLTALAWLKSTFEFKSQPRDVPSEERSLVGPNNVFTEISRWFRSSQQTWDKLKRTSHAGLIAAAKNSLIAADVAGSALPRELPEDTERWKHINTAFANKPEANDLQFIVDWRLKRERRKGKAGILLPFQVAVSESTASVTYVKAGCGSGKTLAAYQWAAKQHPKRRLFFCYPTTGTATEGFNQYLHPPEIHPKEDDPDIERLHQIEADLFHSRRDVDFDIILTTGPDTKAIDADAAIRLESLEAWSTPVVACTVDTVLGLVQNNKRGLFVWPALAQSAFIFDEIHAYDDRLFGALLRFLRDLPGLPALLMTASLPKAREDALMAIVGKEERVLNKIPTHERFAEWEKENPCETIPRYRKEEVKDNDPLPLIRKTLETGGKVLWVCNTVNRAMVAADTAAEFASLTSSGRVFIYHSRFKYEDRVKRHKEVMDGFNPDVNRGSSLAICTQVAEMSLDLSADLLVSDLGSVPALIQRLGRLARRAKLGDATKPFVIIEPPDHLPYTPADLDRARKWIGELTADGISQQQLAEKWEQTGDQPPELVASAWLDGGPTTTVSELREASPGVTVLMDDDAKQMIQYENRIRDAELHARQSRTRLDPSVYRLQRGERHPKDRIRLLIPMPPPPKGVDWHKWRKFKGILIAESDTIVYDSMRGAEWNK